MLLPAVLLPPLLLQAALRREATRGPGVAVVVMIWRQCAHCALSSEAVLLGASVLTSHLRHVLPVTPNMRAIPCMPIPDIYTHLW